METNMNHVERQPENIPLNGINIENGLTSEQRTPSYKAGSGRNEQNDDRCGLKLRERKTTILFVLLVISVSFNIYFIVQKSYRTTEEKEPPEKTKQLEATSALNPFLKTSCSEGWTPNAESCYLFSEIENTWTYSFNNCSSYGASLLVMATHEEMNFINENKAPAEYWIGLQRKRIGELWTLPDGADFKVWFEIKGEGLCASLNDGVVSSTDCDSHRRWICRKTL